MLEGWGIECVRRFGEEICRIVFFEDGRLMELAGDHSKRLCLGIIGVETYGGADGELVNC